MVVLWIYLQKNFCRFYWYIMEWIQQCKHLQRVNIIYVRKDRKVCWKYVMKFNIDEYELILIHVDDANYADHYTTIYLHVYAYYHDRWWWREKLKSYCPKEYSRRTERTGLLTFCNFLILLLNLFPAMCVLP